jgi:hypothetical protein
MGEQAMPYIYKPLWAFGAAGDVETTARLLDWCEKHALQDNGDLFFPQEKGILRDGNRLYRAATIMRNAPPIGHPLAQNEAVFRRLHQYQDPTTGGVYPYIGEDPARPQLPDNCNVLEGAFFGEYALAAGSVEAAARCGRWFVSIVDQNRAHMADSGRFYWQARRDGSLCVDVGSNEEYSKVLTNRPTSQANYPGWVIGCSIAFLADLYLTVMTGSDSETTDAECYIDAARELAAYEAAMPLETYHFPSKCKVAWGAGSLLKALLETNPDDDAIDDAYRIGKRTYLYTFLGTRQAEGFWGPEYYPLSDDVLARAYDYRTMEGLSSVPPDTSGLGDNEGSVDQAYLFLPSVEITGENLAELQYFTTACRDLYSQKARLLLTT